MHAERITGGFRGHPVRIIHFIVWLALSVYVLHMIMPMVHNPSFGIFYRQTENAEVLRIRDFPDIFNFVHAAWDRQTTVNSGLSIYSVENHLKVTSDWAGTRVPYSLPFGYSPTALWVLSPLVPFSHTTAYMIFNIAGLLAAFWMTNPVRCRLGVGLVLFFSPLARSCFYGGQTAIVAAAGLLFLAEKTLGSRRESRREAFVSGIVLWAIAAKPPVALAAGAVLLGLRRWRTLIVAGVLTLISTLLLLPLLGAHWIIDYLHLMRSYNRIDAGPTFAFSIVPELMGNLRAILSVDIGLRDDVASLVSAIVWLIALASVTITGLRLRATAAALWAMGILSYLLFCPHVTLTEVLQAVVLLPLCISFRGRLSDHELFLLIAVALLIFIAPVPGTFIEVRLPLFIAQFVLLLFFAFSREKFASTRPA